MEENLQGFQHLTSQVFETWEVLYALDSNDKCNYGGR
jgi:hypothetical protein